MALAATLADVLPSAPRSTKADLAQRRLADDVDGPVNSRPLTRTVWFSLTNSNCSTDAPMEACQGKPFLAETTTSVAAAVSRETTPAATSWPSVDADRVGVADAAGGIMAEADGPRLRRDGQARQVHDHRVPPAGDPHRPAGVGDHAEARQRRLAVGALGGGRRSPSCAVSSRRLRRLRVVVASSSSCRLPCLLVLLGLRRRPGATVSPSSFISATSLARWRSSVSQSLPWRAYSAASVVVLLARRCGLGVGFLGRVHVLVAIPEPLVRRSPSTSRQLRIDLHGLGQPGGEDAVQDDRLAGGPARRGWTCSRSGGPAAPRRSCSPRSCRRRCCTACSGSGRSR